MSIELEPNESSEDPVEQWIEALAGTDLWAEEKSLAAIHPCPDPRELLDLERGQILDATRRQALARHLVTCPNCIDANLRALFPSRTSSAPTAIVTSIPRAGKRRIATAVSSLAAAFLLAATSWLALEAPLRTSFPISGIHPTDAGGFETRGPALDPADPFAVRRRVSIDVRTTGFVSLVRPTRDPSGSSDDSIEILPVMGRAIVTTVESGEEVLLPLDAAIPCAKGETWLVLFCSRELEADEIRDAASRLLKGYRVDGIEAVRVVPRP